VSAVAADAPRWRLSHGGVVRGGRAPGVTFLRGVPFAVAPEGPRRLALPIAHPGWAGERECSRAGPAAPQWPRGGQAVVGALDCLHLDVWMPDADAPAAGWPVLVWVHGGGFLRGSASEPLYAGATFARAGIVVVLLQYRLGMDGFMDFPGVPPNRGLHDIVAGLQWVQREVSGLGGDPARVTLAGQSAGAGAAACVASLPQAQRLFAQLLLQSPSVTAHTPEDAQRAREAVAALLAVPATAAALLAEPVGRVVQAVQQLAADPALRRARGLGPRHFFPLRPVIDGAVLCDTPVRALQRAWATGGAPRAVLVGANAEEMRLYHVTDGGLGMIADDEVRDFVRGMGLPVDPTCSTWAPTPGEAGERLSQLQSDAYYRAPARSLARAASASGAAAYLYEFTWRSPQCGGLLGAAHGVELPFVFGTQHTDMGRQLVGDAPPVSLATDMQAAWSRFVTMGDPAWPAYADVAPQVQRFDVPSAVVRLPRHDPRLAAWDALI